MEADAQAAQTENDVPVSGNSVLSTAPRSLTYIRAGQSQMGILVQTRLSQFFCKLSSTIPSTCSYTRPAKIRQILLTLFTEYNFFSTCTFCNADEGLKQSKIFSGLEKFFFFGGCGGAAGVA